MTTDADGVKPTERPIAAPRPFHIYQDEDGHPIALSYQYQGPSGGTTLGTVATFSLPNKRAPGRETWSEVKATADLIVTCVNLHDELVEALKIIADIRAYSGDLSDAEIARAVLAKVGK